MKKLVVVLTFIIFSLITFGQIDSTFTQESYFREKYLEYVESCNLKPWTYEKWLDRTQKKLVNEFNQENYITISPGDHLIKGTNQILTGFGMTVLGGIILTSSINNATNTYIGPGLILIGGLFEISGIIHIKNAGISLNQNGIGLKIKF